MASRRYSLWRTRVRSESPFSASRQGLGMRNTNETNRFEDSMRSPRG